MSSFNWPTLGGSGGVPIYSSLAAFPSGTTAGDTAIAADTGILYEWTGAAWQVIAGPGAALSLAAFGSAPNANGLTLSGNALNMQPADATRPGGLSILAQTFTGVKTITSAPIISALSASQAVVTDGSKALASLAYTSANTVSTLVARDGSGNFSAGTITAALTGNASTATTATTATNATNVATTQVSNSASYFPLMVSTSTNGNQAADLGTGLTFNPSTNNLTTTTFTGALAGNATTATTATSATTATTATNATNVATTQVSNSASYFPLMVGSSTNGNQAADLGTGLTFNPSTNNLSTTTFTGALAGNATTATSATSATTATNATNTAITDDTTTNAVMYPTWVTANTGNLPQKVSSTKLSFNPSTAALTATTFVGAVTGTASGNTTYTANNHGLVLSSATNAMTVVAPDASTAKALISGGASADPAWGTLAIGGGGTGQVTKAAAFDALQPMTTGGDIIYGGASGTGTRLANGSSGQVLQSAGGTSAPAWFTPLAMTQQVFTSTGTTVGWWFTVSSANATVGATYTNNGSTFTVLATIAAATTLFTSQANAPTGTGTLTRASGSGDATISFSLAKELATYTTPANTKKIKITTVGGGGGGGGMATAAVSGGGGGGGGAGGTSVKYIASPAATYYYSVGSGGGGGTAGANDGSPGIMSTFNITVLALGGAGGRGSTASTNTIYMGTGGQGAGGSSSGGDENSKGGAGGWGLVLALNNAAGGQGGNSTIGGGGASRIDGGTGNSGGLYGAGGSGGVVISASASAAGGGASDGIVVVEEFY